MTTVELHPQVIIDRLDEIDRELAERCIDLERAARDWFIAKRDREKARAIAFMKATGTVAERQAQADKDTATLGQEQEAEYEALKAVVRTLETRASIGQSLLRAYGRGA